MLSDYEVWQTIDSIDDDTEVHGGDLLVFVDDDSNIIKVRAYKSWSFRLCGDVTEFWLESIESIEDFIPDSLFEEFYTTFNVKDAEVSLSYMTATLTNRTSTGVFRLDRYISAL